LGAASILIAHPDHRVHRTVQRILGGTVQYLRTGTGHHLWEIGDLARAAAQLDHIAPVLTVLDGGAVSSPRGEQLLAAARARGVETCVTLLGPAQLAQLPQLLALGTVPHLFVQPMPMLGEQLTITAQKLIRGELFGVEKYLLWGTELHTATLTRASQRGELAIAVSAKIHDHGHSERVASMAMLAADELLSNAVHNAPVDERGTRYRAELARDQEIKLDERHQVTLRWGCDSRYLAIEVTDRFGSLARDTILRAMMQSDVKDSGGGAGMGITLTYRSCDHLVFNLAPGRRTEVIALIDVRSPRSQRVPATSFNVFVQGAR
jgi:hypothetical protein